MMSEADNTSKQKLEKNLQFGPKTEADDQSKFEARKESVWDAENDTTHEGKSSNVSDEKQRMLVIAGNHSKNSLGGNKSVPFE